MGLGTTTAVEEMISGTETNLQALIDGFMWFVFGDRKMHEAYQSFGIPDAFWILDLIPRHN